MNLLLLDTEDLRPDGTAVLRGRAVVHARKVLRVQPGDTLRIGRLGGLLGEGTVRALQPDALVLEVRWTAPPPPRPGIDLLLALPRPKALKRVLSTVASLGVDRVVLTNAARVEASYFDSKVLAPEALHRLMLEGLEQAKDTRAPQVLIRDRFRPFVEDELDGLFPREAQRKVAHPGPPTPLSSPAPGTRQLLAVGPEGGWVPFELELLAQHGFTLYSAGPRSLRVEVALPFLLGALASTIVSGDK